MKYYKHNAPTVAEYLAQTKQIYTDVGFTTKEADCLVEHASLDLEKAGITSYDEVLKVPDPLGQKKRPLGGANGF